MSLTRLTISGLAKDLKGTFTKKVRMITKEDEFDITDQVELCEGNVCFSGTGNITLAGQLLISEVADIDFKISKYDSNDALVTGSEEYFGRTGARKVPYVYSTSFVDGEYLVMEVHSMSDVREVKNTCFLESSIDVSNLSGTDPQTASNTSAISTINDDINGIYQDLDDKIDRVTSVDGNVPAFDGTEGDLKNSPLFVSSNGNVGIGTDTPERDLHIDDGIFRIDRKSNSAAVMMVRKDSSDTILKTYAMVVDSSGSGDGELQFRDFNTSASGGSTLRMRIKDDGDMDVNNNSIINVGTPTNPKDAATKEYVDNSTSVDPQTAINTTAISEINSLDISEQYIQNGNTFLMYNGTNYEPVDLSGEMVRSFEDITDTDLTNWATDGTATLTATGNNDPEGHAFYTITSNTATRIAELPVPSLSTSVSDPLDASLLYDVTFFSKVTTFGIVHVGLTTSTANFSTEADFVRADSGLSRTTDSASPLFQTAEYELINGDTHKITLKGCTFDGNTRFYIRNFNANPIISAPHIRGRLVNVPPVATATGGQKYTVKHLVDRNTTLATNTFSNVDMTPLTTTVFPSSVTPGYTINNSELTFNREGIVAGYLNMKLRSTTVGATGDLQMTVTLRDSTNATVAIFRGELSDTYINGDRISIYAFVQPGDRLTFQGNQTTGLTKNLDFGDLVLWIEEI